MSEAPRPVRLLWNIILGLFVGCVLLWLAVQLLEAIWPWLIGAAVLIVAIGVLVAWLRWRRRQW